MRTAIIGAGSIGTILGAMVTEKGGQIDMIDSYQKNVDVLNEKGAKITGFLETTVPVTALTPDQMEGVYDLVLLSTKQTSNDVVMKSVLPHIDENSLVLTLQNGIPEEEISGYVGKDRVAGGAVGFGATWIEPGVSRLTSTLEAVQKYGFDIGEIDGSITPRIQAAKELLDLCGGTTILTNLMGVRWNKVLMNATFSGMSAACGCTFGRVLDDEIAIQCIAHLADETIKVAHAKGVQLPIMQGVDFNKLELATKEDIPQKIPTYIDVWSQHRELKASMLQDLEKQRKTEISYINGHVSAKGKEVGIATPFNDMVVKIVLEEEKQKKVSCFEEAIKNFLPLL